MTNLRQRVAYVALGAMLAHVFGLVAAAILSRILTKDVYGTYRQAFLLYQILVGVMGLNIGASMLFFLPRSDAAKRRGIVAQSTVIGLLVGLAVGLVMFAGSPLMGQAISNPDVVPLLYIIAVFAVFNQVTLMVPNALIAVDKAPLVFGYTVAAAVGRTAVTVVPFLLGMSLSTVLMIVTLWEFVLAALGLYLMHVTIGIGLRAITWKGLREEFGYMWPLLAAAVIGTVSMQFDKAVISVAFDPAAYAEYSNGALQIPLVFIVISSINTSILPDMSRLAAEGRIDLMLDLWRRAAVKGATLVFPIVVFCLLCPDYIVLVLYGDQYLMSAVPFAIYCVGLLLRVAYFGAVFQAVGRNQVQIVGALVALVSGLVTTLVLVYIGRGTILAFAGPAIGTVAATFMSMAVLIGFISRLCACRYRHVLPLATLGRLALLTLASAAPAFALRWVPAPPLVKSVLMGTVLVAIYVGAGLATRIVLKEDVRFATRPLAAVWGQATRWLRRSGGDSPP